MTVDGTNGTGKGRGCLESGLTRSNRDFVGFMEFAKSNQVRVHGFENFITLAER